MATLRGAVFCLLITSTIPWATFALIPLQFKTPAELNKQPPANQPATQTNCNPVAPLTNQAPLNNNYLSPANTPVAPSPITNPYLNVTNSPTQQTAAPATSAVAPSNTTTSGGILLSDATPSSDNWVIH